MKAKKITLAKRFEGAPKPSDFKIIEEELPEELKNGEVLVEAEWLTVDPYMRGRANMMKIGETFVGQQVGRVLKSKNPKYPVGTQLVGNFGWRNLTIYTPGDVENFETAYKMPDMKGLPDSYALGSIGMPGNTANFGLRLCEPKKGDVLVVSAAAGAVGSIVGQIAKLKGLTVIGFAGEDDKVEWLKKDLGFDHAFNYKKVNLHETLQKYAPKGVDCYFDNVGGDFTYNVIRNMKQFGRISLCGAVSYYNNDPTKPTLVPLDYGSLIYKQIRMEGFMVLRWQSEWFQGLEQLRDWILEGKIKVSQTVKEGFDQMPQAFIELLEGKNTGKMVVKA